jgi:hypothetical protein
MDDLELRSSFATSRHQLALKPLQRLVHRRHIGFEVDGLDSGANSRWRLYLFSVSSLRYRFSRFFVRCPPPFGFTLVPELLAFG